MPDGQAVLRQVTSYDWSCGDSQKTAHRPGRENADDQASQHEQLHRYTHPVRRLVRLVREIVCLGPKKDIERKAQRIGHAEHARHGRHHGQHSLDPGCCIQIDSLGKEHLLGDEAVEQGHTGHGGTGHTGQRGRDRHHEAQTRQAPDVTRAAFMVHNARRHEQRSLEGRVIHDVKYRRHGSQLAVQAQQQGNQPQMRDR